jgi:hypothetical protein
MTPARSLSKSRYCIGLQCLRRLWWQVHEPDAPELQVDERAQAVFDRGQRVGELARARFPDGLLLDYGPRQVKERVAATEVALEEGARVLFEASFEAGGVFAALDVLERRRGGWTLVEVKATLDVKEQHLPDIAVQLHAARAAGLDVRRAEHMHLNRACAYPHLDELFTRQDVTAKVEPLLPAIPGQLRQMRAALDGTLPNVEPGARCTTPYACPFAPRCHPELPEHHVSTLHGVRAPRIAAWLADGIERLSDLPDDARLTGAQARQVRAVKRGELVVEEGLARALRAIARPVAFLDFETVNPPVPAWDGCHPYEATPVQMSCHVLGPRGRVEHHAHLADGPGDPRPALAQAVVRACRDAESVVAYNAQFEARCLEHLALAVPRLSARLRAIRARLVDLLPIVRDHVYHPAFGGGFGLKAVAPALLRGAGYDHLAVADGDTASTLLEALLLAPEQLDAAARTKLRAQLLAYCARDTEVLLEVHERLAALAQGSDILRT